MPVCMAIGVRHQFGIHLIDTAAVATVTTVKELFEQVQPRNIIKKFFFYDRL